MWFDISVSFLHQLQSINHIQNPIEFTTSRFSNAIRRDVHFLARARIDLPIASISP